MDNLINLISACLTSAVFKHTVLGGALIMLGFAAPVELVSPFLWGKLLKLKKRGSSTRKLTTVYHVIVVLLIVSLVLGVVVLATSPLPI